MKAALSGAALLTGQNAPRVGTGSPDAGAPATQSPLLLLRCRRASINKINEYQGAANGSATFCLFRYTARFQSTDFLIAGDWPGDPERRDPMIENAYITTLTAANDTTGDASCTVAIHGLIVLLARAELRKISRQAANSDIPQTEQVSK